jgi:ADP-L-glycero-D-manno-heptose 6-epimerase
METRPESGLFNLGTGKARSFLDLVRATFSAMKMPEQILFIDTPEDIRDTYQYFTEAEMKKLRKAGYRGEFTSLEEGVREYVTKYLLKNTYH